MTGAVFLCFLLLALWQTDSSELWLGLDPDMALSHCGRREQSLLVLRLSQWSLLMLTLLLDVRAVWMWAVLPAFQSCILLPSLWSKWVSSYLNRTMEGKVWVHAHSGSLGVADRRKLVVKWPLCRAMEFPKKTQILVFPWGDPSKYSSGIILQWTKWCGNWQRGHCWLEGRLRRDWKEGKWEMVLWK